MRKAVALVLGIALGVNGVWMLSAPEHWYLRVPGVMATGPANLHFIRDIGCAYIVVAASLAWLATRPAQAWPAALACGVFLALHALVHVWDAAAGRECIRCLLAELPTIVLPAILAIWLAWPTHYPAGKER